MRQMIKNLDNSSACSERELANWGLENFIYIRPISMEELAEEMLHKGGAFDVDVASEATLVSLHAADGSRIAVTIDEMAAFETAQRNEMEIASVH